MLPEHAHLSPMLAGLQELPGRQPLLGAGGLAPQGQRAGGPGGLHVPDLRQHAGGLQASSKPSESAPSAQMSLEVMSSNLLLRCWFRDLILRCVYMNR